MAGQQGAYLAHMINRGYHVGLGGLDRPAPSRPSPPGPAELLRRVVATRVATKRADSKPAETAAESIHGDEATAGSGGSVYDSLGASVAAPGTKLEHYERPFGKR